MEKRKPFPMPTPPEGCVPFPILMDEVLAVCPHAVGLVSSQQLRHAAYNGVIKTVRVEGRVYVPRTEIPRLIRHFKLDYIPTLPLVAA
jgi:hypothetical protein